MISTVTFKCSSFQLSTSEMKQISECTPSSTVDWVHHLWVTLHSKHFTALTAHNAHSTACPQGRNFTLTGSSSQSSQIFAAGGTLALTAWSPVSSGIEVSWSPPFGLTFLTHWLVSFRSNFLAKVSLTLESTSLLKEEHDLNLWNNQAWRI